MIIRPNAGFIIPTRRFVEAGIAPSKVGMSGRYQLIVRDAWGVEKRRTPWFDNLILDSGLNRYGSGGVIFGAAIGTGTSTPVASQTELDTQTHYTTTQGTGHGARSVFGSSPYNNTYTAVYRTTLGALNGNYYEVGVGWASGLMFSRALILDGGGSPTFVAVSSAEQLDIVYQLSIYPPLSDTSDSVTISGIGHTVTGRASNVNTTGGFTPAWGVQTTGRPVLIEFGNVYDGSIGAITSTPSGALASTGIPSTAAYVNNSFNSTGTLSFGLDAGNASGGIDAINVGWGVGNVAWFAGFQYGFSPVIAKDATKTLTLTFSMNWARRP